MQQAIRDVDKQIDAACYTCLFQQVLSLATLMELTAAQTKNLFEEVMQYLFATHGRGIVVQHVVRKATDAVFALLNRPDDFDPYKPLKIQSNEIAETHYPQFKRQIEESSAPVETALKIAAAGNIIDFGAMQQDTLDVDRELAAIDQRGFGIYHNAALVQGLSAARRLLYICDNAGEIVLDKVFIETLKAAYPSLQVSCAVREKPIINDAVLADAYDVGLDRVACVISSGSVYPGTILDETAPEFRDLFDSADLIIAKGQGNFETLLATDTEKIFFLLRIKCAPMARLSGVRQGDLVLMQSGRLQAAG